MKTFSVNIYSEEEAFFETLKRLYSSDEERKIAINAFSEYLKTKKEEKGKAQDEFDFMVEWLKENRNLTDFRQVTDDEGNAFGLDAGLYYIDDSEK